MTAQSTMPASDDLTPEVLARWEELAAVATPGPWDADAVRPFAEISSADADFVSTARPAFPALLSGVRSRDARIAELEAELVTVEQQRSDNLKAIAERDAVIEDVRGAWTGADIDAVLEAAPSSVLAARDARVKAEALDAEVEALRGYTLDHRSPEAIFDHVIRLIERDAAMHREQVK